MISHQPIQRGTILKGYGDHTLFEEAFRGRPLMIWGVGPEEIEEKTISEAKGHKGMQISVYRGVSNCSPHQFWEICIPLCNDPIGLIQKGHLKCSTFRVLQIYLHSSFTYSQFVTIHVLLYLYVILC